MTPRESGLLPYARDGLLAYMEQWSEDNYCAGWLIGLPKTMWQADEKFREWVAAAGGYWDWDGKAVWQAGVPC